MGSGSETNSPSSGGKRSRDPEDEVYLDNLRSHKRYLSEIMASSLNGLSVGDTLPETVMDSPARSESMYYMRDDFTSQYSPMSEDLSDDGTTRFCDIPTHTNTSHFFSQTESSTPTSPVSPYRYKPLNAFCASPPHHTTSQQPSTSSNNNNSSSFPTTTSALPSLSTSSSCQPRQQRGCGSSSDTEGRFPSSPSDICHSSDLRRAALLRSVQMRSSSGGCSSTQPTTTMGAGGTCVAAVQSPFESNFGSLGQHEGGGGAHDGDIIRDQSEEEQEVYGPSCCPYMMKARDDDYLIENDGGGCSLTPMAMSEPDCDDDHQGKLCRDLDVGKTGINDEG